MKKILPPRTWKLLLASVATLSVSIAPTVSAHTTIVPSTMGEGQRVFADVSISHGCNGRAVRAMSIGFPSDASMLEKVADPDNLEANIEDHLDLGSHSSPRLAQDKDVFKKMYVMAPGSSRAFHYTKGYLDPGLMGQIPFRFSAPTFKPDSCAKQVDILIPIVNWCSKSKTDPARVDVWIGRLTGKFNDTDVQSIGFWPKITVLRDMNANPFTDPAACGEGIDLEWSLTDEEIDDLVPISRFWPANVN